MGNNLSTELASGELNITMRDSIAIQLQNNHYPPVPLTMIEPCIEAIEAINEMEYDKLIKLPIDGLDRNGEPFQITWRGQDHAPAWAIVEGHHLDAWLAHAWDCDCDACLEGIDE